MDSPSLINPGAIKPSTNWGEYNNIAFAIQQAILKLQTATVVRINACTNAGDISPVGFVDVTPLVNQIDGSIPPNPTPHATIYGLPYLRLQGGANAIIIDPQVGDIGIAVFASRDISNVKRIKAQSTPGSHRTYDFSDGIYLGGILNGTPTQYVRFASDGIRLVAANIQMSDGVMPPVPVVSQPFFTWFNAVLMPLLATHGITPSTPPPATSVTTVFKAI